METTDSRSRASELYNSLLALLHTACPASNPAERWKGLAPAMALQILRYANAPTSLPGFESQLAACLDDVNSDMFRDVESHFQRRLIADLARHVSEFKNLSGVALFSHATGGRVPRRCGGCGDQNRSTGALFGGEAPREPRDDAGVDDMAVRLAHLGVLHWRVWAPLAYEGDIESDLNAMQNSMI